MNPTSLPTPKQRVGILFGGKSAEHEVSIQSARTIIEALDKDKFEPIPISISREGKWHLLNTEVRLSLDGSHELLSTTHSPIQVPDVIFPILHGPLGEDGAVQGLLEMADIPYVGAGIVGSALGMDKDVMKRLLRDAGVAVVDYIVLRNASQIDSKKIFEKLGAPLFVKPANMGSSVGVSKVEDEAGLLRAIELGFRYDRKVLIERAIDGDEVECAVLGNDHPKASVSGRIVHRSGFYTYDAKYEEAEGTTLEIPAKLPIAMQQKVQEIAIRVYQVLECQGMARVDMFVTKQGIIVNEINTLPGFTKQSMYPQLWEASGLSCTNLITELLDLAIDRHQRRRQLLTVRNHLHADKDVSEDAK